MPSHVEKFCKIGRKSAKSCKILQDITDIIFIIHRIAAVFCTHCPWNLALFLNTFFLNRLQWEPIESQQDLDALVPELAEFSALPEEPGAMAQELGVTLVEFGTWLRQLKRHLLRKTLMASSQSAGTPATPPELQTTAARLGLGAYRRSRGANTPVTATRAALNSQHMRLIVGPAINAARSEQHVRSHRSLGGMFTKASTTGLLGQATNRAHRKSYTGLVPRPANAGQQSVRTHQEPSRGTAPKRVRCATRAHHRHLSSSRIAVSSPRVPRSAFRRASQAASGQSGPRRWRHLMAARSAATTQPAILR